MPDVLDEVGNDSVETTSNAFQPHVLKALNKQPPNTTIGAPNLVPNAKREAEAAASVIDNESSRLRPTCEGVFMAQGLGEMLVYIDK